MRIPFSPDLGWTLFLDRDGVINVRFPGDYVKRVEEFEFLPGVPQAIAKLSHMFGRVIVVTNQQGISKGYYSHKDLEEIHDFMKREVEKAGGKIEAVYYAHQLAEENSPMRKPGIGMALQAKKDFPQIDFARSVMVGDTDSDMEFAKRAGMRSVFVGGRELLATPVDAVCDTLADFAEKLGKQ